MNKPKYHQWTDADRENEYRRQKQISGFGKYGPPQDWRKEQVYRSAKVEVLINEMRQERKEQEDG